MGIVYFRKEVTEQWDEEELHQLLVKMKKVLSKTLKNLNLIQIIGKRI